MRVQLLLLREPLCISDALATDPKVGTIDPEFGGQVVIHKHATQIGLNRFEVTIWHEGDNDEVATDLDDIPLIGINSIRSALAEPHATDLDDVHPFFAATFVSACLLLALAVIVALVEGVVVLIKLVF